MHDCLSYNEGLKSSVVSQISVNVDSFISTDSKRSPQYFFLSFRSNTEGYNFFDNLFGFEIGSLLHGDLAERIDVHSGIGKVYGVVLNLNLL